MFFGSAQICSGSPHVFITASLQLQEGFLSGALACTQYFWRLPTLFDVVFFQSVLLFMNLQNPQSLQINALLKKGLLKLFANLQSKVPKVIYC